MASASCLRKRWRTSMHRPRAEQQLRSWQNGQDFAALGALREFGESLLSQLHSDIEAVLRLIRWRRGMPGPAEPIRSSHGMQWSDDGQEWHFFPLEGKVRPATYVAVRLTPKQIAQIEAMYRTSKSRSLMCSSERPKSCSLATRPAP